MPIRIYECNTPIYKFIAYENNFTKNQFEVVARSDGLVLVRSLAGAFPGMGHGRIGGSGGNDA